MDALLEVAECLHDGHEPALGACDYCRATVCVECDYVLANMDYESDLTLCANCFDEWQERV